MVYCTHCADYCPYIKDPDKGYICCGTCGKVLDQEIYTDEPTFVKDSSGASRLAGNILSSIESGSSLSHERTLMKGRDEIWQIVTSLHLGGGDTIIDMAHKFYTLAVDHNFTRGRRTSHVAAACLYIACRQSKKAYLLIDFSDYLKISVYVLGAVFLQLCQVLLLAEHPIVQKLIDPSLFIHRFTERLLGKRDNAVSDTALRIVASMKRDWMQTGRKPSGLCGAALYIAALSHGYNYTKSNIDSVGDKSATIGSGEIPKDYVPSKDPEVGGENGKADADPESFSDIDDVEVDGYLHNEEETQYKKIIWEEMNKEYLEEQAAKEALAAELAARGVGVGEGQQKKRRRNEDTKNSTPAETPAEATYNMLKRKGLGSKINVEAVGGLYNTKDEDGEANEKGDMSFDGEYAHDTGDGETLEGGYDYADYNNDGYANFGDAGAYEDYDGIDY